jgi:aspartyl-tRNA(Asn)/glutamyl-tRNA(Gln) amidotransferase subunit B
MSRADYEVVIGLEVHCQLRTASKMFSACAYAYVAGSQPNTQIDAYTLGLPGTLPVPNRAAVEAALRLALAVDCEISPRSRWARKHYFYPDLPKGYQITQSDSPYASGGAIEIPDPTQGELGSKTIPLQRIHMEEDAGKSTHAGELSLVDYDRAGAPLVEIVSLPALRSAAEAAEYVRELRTLVRYLGISEANMEQGTLRCDANVSLRRRGATTYGVRCEIKNLNSFKFLELAIEAEVRRQLDLLERGEPIIQSTLTYDTVRDQTRIMRSKEDAADYRYFPEPDMPALQIDEAWIERARVSLPELPWPRRRRLAALGLSAYDVGVLTAERELAEYFDAVVRHTGQDSAKQACNWITGELLRLLHAEGLDITRCPVPAAALAELIGLVEDGTISGRVGKTVLEAMFRSPALTPAQIIERDGHRQVSDVDAIVSLVREVVAEYPEQLAEWLAGKDKVRGFFVGQVMRASKGQANPQVVQQALATVLEQARASQ